MSWVGKKETWGKGRGELCLGTKPAGLSCREVEQILSADWRQDPDLVNQEEKRGLTCVRVC